jgi:soluble lytic murein transglycosylase-like protein
MSAEIIDLHLHGRGEVIIREAERAGIKLPLACALIEQESGGRNIFGCDHGPANTWTPPYCNVPVTWERVQLLLQHIDEGGGSSGVGLSQITYPPLIREAEALGGAHLPRYQLRVGFRVLRDYLDTYPLRKAIGAYNGGPSNPQYDYADEVLAKRDEWRERLGL